MTARRRCSKCGGAGPFYPSQPYWCIRCRELYRLRERARSRVCECGRPKGWKAEACGRCVFLDGTPGKIASAIAVFRMLGGSGSLVELAGVAEKSLSWADKITRALVALDRAVCVMRVEATDGAGAESSIFSLVEKR